MIDNDQFPFVPPKLLEALDERFPERCPDPTETLDKIRHNAGARSVVRFLHRISEEQQEHLVEAEGPTGDVIDVSRKVLSGEELTDHVTLRVPQA